MLLLNTKFIYDSNTQISLKSSSVTSLKLNNDFGFKPTSDTITAIQLQKADGTNVLNIDTTNGNVGIGTTSPSYKLHVSGGRTRLVPTAEPYALALGRSEIGNYYYLGVSNDANPHLVFSNNAGVERMRIEDGGNVGIGTNDPGNLLHIQGTGGTIPTQLRLGVTDSDQYYDIGRDWNGGYLAFYGAQASPYSGFKWYTAGTQKMTMLSNGNVGIGDTTPSYQLELSTDSAAKPTSNTWTVPSDRRIKKDIYAFTDGLDVIKQINPVHYTLNGLGGTTEGMQGIGVIAQDVMDIAPYTVNSRMGKLYPDDEEETEIYDFNFGALNFAVINAIDEITDIIDLTLAPTTTPSLVIDQNGNVGIGTTSPSYKLDVLASGTGVIARFNSTNSTGCTLADGGTITCTSDEKFKKNIVNYENGLNILMSLRPVEYNWKYENDGITKSFGFLAQEVETVLPKLVMTDDKGYKELNTIGLIPVIVKSIQDQQGLMDVQTDTISGLSLKTDQNITTLQDLQASVDTQLTTIGTALADQESRIENQETAFADQESKIADYETLSAQQEGRITGLETLMSQLQLDANVQVSKIETLETQMEELIEFYSVFDLGNLLVKDTDGNLDLTRDALGNPVLLGGKLKANILETGALTIEVIDPDAPTIGTAKILPVAVDADDDGIDDETGGDGKSVVIQTKAVSEKSRIFVTLKKLLDVPLAVTKIKDGESFKVEIKTSVVEPVEFDWIVVEEK